jgi:hypothetical protein
MKRWPTTIALFVVAMHSPFANACSCVHQAESADRVRARISALFEYHQNVLVVRAVEVFTVQPFHEKAKLVVVRSYKGDLKAGDVIQSDTDGIGGGMCDSSIGVGEEILVAFDAQPIRINGCPDDFQLTPLERKYLRILAPLRRKNVSSVSTSRG